MKEIIKTAVRLSSLEQRIKHLERFVGIERKEIPSEPTFPHHHPQRLTIEAGPGDEVTIIHTRSAVDGPKNALIVMVNKKEVLFIEGHGSSDVSYF